MLVRNGKRSERVLVSVMSPQLPGLYFRVTDTCGVHLTQPPVLFSQASARMTGEIHVSHLEWHSHNNVDYPKVWQNPQKLSNCTVNATGVGWN